MLTAFVYLDERIAPVFDAAEDVCLVRAEGGVVVDETRIRMPADDLFRKVACLDGQRVGMVVCGALSRQAREVIAAYGITVKGFVAGELREVIAAWLRDGLDSEIFAMPGCCGARKRRKAGCEGGFGFGKRRNNRKNCTQGE